MSLCPYLHGGTCCLILLACHLTLWRDLSPEEKARRNRNQRNNNRAWRKQHPEESKKGNDKWKERQRQEIAAVREAEKALGSLDQTTTPKALFKKTLVFVRPYSIS
jgi:hypothetical protein